MEQTIDPQVEERELINPIPDQCPRHILSRPLKVIAGDFTSFESKTIISNWLSRYAAVLDTFEYWKADFRLKCVLRSSATSYGWGLVGYVYGPMPAVDAADRLRFLSTTECAFIDVTSADAVTLEVPFCFPASYFQRNTTNIDDYFTFFVHAPAANLANISSGTPAVQLDVFVEAYNIDVGGYIQPTIAPAITFEPIEPHGDLMVPGQGMRGLLPVVRRNAGTLGTLGTIAATAAWRGFGALATVDKNLEVAKKYTVGREPAQPDKPKKDTDKLEAKAMQITPYGNLNSMVEQSTTIELAAEGPGGMFCDPTQTKLSDLVMIPQIQNVKTFTDASGLDISENIVLDDFGPMGQVLADTFRYNRGTHRVALTFFTHPLIGARFQVQIFYSSTSNDLINTAVPSHYFLIKGSETKIFDVPFHLDTLVAEGSRGVSTQRIIAVMKITCTHLPQPFATGVTAKVFMIPTVSGTEDCQFFSLRARVPVPAPVAIEAHSLRMLHRQKGEIFGTETKEIPYLPEITTLEQLCQRWALRGLYPNQLGETFRLDPVPYGLMAVNGRSLNSESIAYGCEYDIWSQAFALTRSSMDLKVALQSVPAAGLPGQYENVAWVAMQSEGDTSGTIDSALDPRNGATYAYPTLQPCVDYRVPFLSRYRSNGITVAALGFVPQSAQIGTNHNLEAYAPNNGIDVRKQIIWARAGPDLHFHKVNYVPLHYKQLLPP